MHTSVFLSMIVLVCALTYYGGYTARSTRPRLCPGLRQWCNGISQTCQKEKQGTSAQRANLCTLTACSFALLVHVRSKALVNITLGNRKIEV